MIIKTVEIKKFRAFENVSFALGKRITAISGRNATQKTTLLGMIGQPFSISARDNPMYGCKTIDGYNFRSQFRDKFRISPEHDIIGEHKWTLKLNNRIYEPECYSVESIARKQVGKESTLRFWNAKSRKKGAGYVQLPVYFLSLSRIFPIGEAKKTHAMQITLTDEEAEYCIKHYRHILSIQNMGEANGNPSLGIEKSGASRIFAGVSDKVHDIFTNSAGEGNVMRIIFAVLSFRRLRENYGANYKGGILLIDELDATLHGFSQEKLVDYLWQAAGDYKIQIIFTTHSPIVLRSVNKYQRDDRKKQGESLPCCSYNSAIVYLKPRYNEKGERTVTAENISSTIDLNRILGDINLKLATNNNSKMHIYCEDARAISFLKHILSTKLSVELDRYMEFIDANLGWTNYIQLVGKGIPEFMNNIIVLDGDVPQKKEYKSKEAEIKKSKNIIFLPIAVERGLFEFLKKPDVFLRFEQNLPKDRRFSFEICFNAWPGVPDTYETKDFKKWYSHVEGMLGNMELLFAFWCNENSEEVTAFINKFVNTFNELAEENAVDGIPEGIWHNDEKQVTS